MNSVKPVSLNKSFKAYAPIQTSCLKLIENEDPYFETLGTECSSFIKVLGKANDAVITMNINKNNASFYVAKERYKKEKLRLKKHHKHLNLIIKGKALDAIDKDQLDKFTTLVQFSYHPMNISYYRYMKRNMPHFKSTKKYFHFEKKYSLKKYKKGYRLVNKGKYTSGLNELTVAAQMNNVKAARLCGDTFMYIYPQKAQSCYQEGVRLGNKHMLYSLALAYEKNSEPEKAYELYQRSADKGNFISQYKLFTLKPNENLSWLQKSADTGYDIALYEYGMHLYKNKETNLAISYLKKASGLAYTKANYPLGSLYFSTKSYKNAFKYLSLGEINADSMYKLGYLSEKGKGTHKNYYAAFKYYYKAQKLGKKSATKDVKRMAYAKKKLRNKQLKKQKSAADRHYKEMVTKEKLRDKVAVEDQKIHDQWKATKDDAARLKANACGAEITGSGLKTSGSRIHIQGTVAHWLGKNAFVVNDSGTEYYILDDSDLAGVNKGDYINMVGVTTGKREIVRGLKRSIFDDTDGSAIAKAYSLSYEGTCPY